MKYWRPHPDEPELMEWWRPLVLVIRRAIDDEFPWVVRLDDFIVSGRVIRSGRPDVWVYRLLTTGGELLADAEGQTYRFVPTPNAVGPGRLYPNEIRSAIWGSGLPHVAPVQPGLDTGPPEPAWDEDEAPGPMRDGWVAATVGRPVLRVVR